MKPALLGLKAVRRSLPQKRVSDSVVGPLEEVRERARQQDWEAALAAGRRAADAAEASGSRRAMRVVGGKLIRLGDCGRGLRLLAEPGDCNAREWAGEALRGRRLFVRQLHTSNMGAPIRMAKFLSFVVREAGTCVVIVEPRLVPLFQRSFPAANVRPVGGTATADATSQDYVTSFEGLAGRCVTDWESVEAFPFTPLRADETVTAALRQDYGGGTRTLVGISWGSKNSEKGTPDLEVWAELIAAFPATFVSLQYGKIEKAVEKLRGAVPEKLIYDRSVDQLIDMDRFAAQVAAVDAVISITNTGAHLAGAMGKPTVLLADDRFRGPYPSMGEKSRWYPSMVMARRGARDWSVAVTEAARRLEGMIRRPDAV